MQKTVSGFTPGEMKISVLHIYGYKDKQLQGELENPYYGKRIPFDNALQLLFLLEQLADVLQFPQKSVEDRSFVEEANDGWKPRTEVDETERPKALATFTLRLLFRQNASWQGILGWKESRTEAPFRSVLELLKLMDSVLVKQ